MDSTKPRNLHWASVTEVTNDKLSGKPLQNRVVTVALRGSYHIDEISTYDPQSILPRIGAAMGLDSRLCDDVRTLRTVCRRRRTDMLAEVTISDAWLR